jgi:hypothetical protein
MALPVIISLVTACGGGNGDTSSAGLGKPSSYDALTQSTSTSTYQLSAQQLVNDMSLPHEAAIFGIDPSWDWGTGPRIGAGVNFPLSYDDPRFVPWGIVATPTSGNPATNVRVQIRKMIVDVKRNGLWSRVVYNTSGSQIMGALFTNYEQNTSVPADIRYYGEDGISVKLPNGVGSFHFYSSNRFPIARGAQEIVSRLEARLILDDATKPNDIANAKLLINAAGDIWRNNTAQWDPVAQNNVDFAIGRFKYVQPYWTVVTSHTMRTLAEVNDYLANEGTLYPR